MAGSELAPGTMVAGYRIEGVIGRGGMGAVYRAVEAGLQRNVALKVIAPELAQGERFRERFLHESRIAASLDHPHVIPIYQAGEDRGVLFLAMRFVEGTDLARLVAEHGALEPRRAVDLLSQVAEALDAAHKLGLVHRDVKPSNVLVASGSGSEHCYLGDFGLTKRTGSLSAASAAGEIVGTLEYVAPEQITGASLDARADVYSLGGVLYHCLTGQPPFPRATDVALLWAHVHEQPTPPSKARPGLPREFDAVNARALAKDPARRYGSAGELLAASRVALGVDETPPRERSAPGLLRRQWTPRRALAALAAAAAAVAIAVAGVLIERREPDPVVVPPNSVAVIDSSSNLVVDTIKVGIGPSAMASGAGAVWVANVEDQTLSRIDPRTRTVERTVPLEGTPTGVAAGGTGVWVVYGLGGSVAHIDAKPPYEILGTTEDVVGRSSGGAIAEGEAAVWVVSRRGELAEIDSDTGQVVARIPVGESASAVAAGSNYVWVANGGASTVSVVNPRTRSVIRTPSVGAGPSALAVGEGGVWVANTDDGTVTRIDPRNFSAQTINVGAGPAGVATGSGAVWVANGDEGTVSRIDPTTREVTATIDVGNRPQSVAVTGGVVWVTVQAP